jgi:iron complex transport system substrate-binding protein
MMLHISTVLGATLRNALLQPACGVLMAVVLLASAPAFADEPARIITMAPNLTEIVFALGAGDRLVAVSEYSDYPKEASALPHTGGFINPDIERVLAYQPDLVILRDYSTRLERKLIAFGISVLRVRDESIADILETIRAIGDALGVGPQALRLIASIEDDLEPFRRRPEPAHRPRVLLVPARDDPLGRRGESVRRFNDPVSEALQGGDHRP